MYKKSSVWSELETHPKQNTSKQVKNYRRRQSSVRSCVFCVYLGHLIDWNALIWKHAGVLCTLGIYHMMSVIYSDNLSKS